MKSSQMDLNCIQENGGEPTLKLVKIFKILKIAITYLYQTIQT